MAARNYPANNAAQAFLQETYQKEKDASLRYHLRMRDKRSGKLTPPPKVNFEKMPQDYTPGQCAIKVREEEERKKLEAIKEGKALYKKQDYMFPGGFTYVGPAKPETQDHIAIGRDGKLHLVPPIAKVPPPTENPQKYGWKISSDKTTPLYSRPVYANVNQFLIYDEFQNPVAKVTEPPI